MLNKEDFESSVCIKKFYNSEDGKYYETNNPNFRWPRLEHGNSHPDAISYSIVMERCKEETLELLLGEGNTCKDDETVIPFNALQYNNSSIIRVYRNGVRLFQDLDYHMDKMAETITLFVRTELDERIVFESTNI